MIAIYEKKDLIEVSQDKDIRDINQSDIRMSRENWLQSDVFIYIDRDQALLRVLKHRDNQYVSRTVYDLSELHNILVDGVKPVKSLGKSTFIPGTKKKRP